MTLAVDPLVGSTRAVVLAASESAVRGAAGEYRHHGLSLTVRVNVLAALTDLVRDPTAVLVVAADVSGSDLEDVLDLAIATCGSTVLLGMTPSTEAATVTLAFKAGVHGCVELPLTPDKLRSALRVIPPRGAVVLPIRVGDLVVDTARHHIAWRGERIDATPREFSVILDLVRRHPEVVTLDELARAYPGATTDPLGAVRVTITHLRSRLAAVGGPGATTIIETVRGVGYRLSV